MIQFSSLWLAALQRGEGRRRVGKGYRRRQQFATARHYTEALETRTLLSSPSVTISFQDGVDGYSGTRDVSLDGFKSGVNDGARKKLEADGDPDVAALLSWDVSRIHQSSQVVAASITLNVINSSKHEFEVYGLNRVWLENEATFIHAAAGAAWDRAGAAGALDRDNAVLGTVAGASLGLVTLPLNANGVAAVQRWISNPTLNFGLTVQNFDNARKDKLVVSSSEDRLAALRPRLQVTYTTGQTNAAPKADSQTLDSPEDMSLPITLTGSDPDGDALSYHIVSGPAEGTLSGTAPNVVYRPRSNFHGTDAFTFRVHDGLADSEIATVSINVAPVNDAPTAVDRSETTRQDTPAATELMASDVDGDALTYRIVDPPLFGTLSGTAPNLTYNPDAGFSGGDRFTWVANDGNDESLPATVAIQVDAANHAPTAVDGSVTTRQDTPVATELMASDVDGDALTYRIIDAPLHGTLSGTAPNFTYNPDAGFFGGDRFTWVASDGNDESLPATVTIQVNATVSSLTVSFQDGVDGYNGTRDAYGREDFPTNTTGGKDTLMLDGAPNQASFIAFDLSSIPPDSTVLDASLGLNVVNVSVGAYSIYALQRPWVEHEATFLQARAGDNWNGGGASGMPDRESTVLGTLSSTSLQWVTVPMNLDGVAAVQSWVSGASPNFGFTIQNFADGNFDDLDVSSSEFLTVTLRPKLTVTYRVGQPSPPPTLATNAALDLEEGQEATIGPDRLEVTDLDNADTELTFSLTAAPQHGVLEVNGTALAAGGIWTQADINNNRVEYVHDGSETTSDSFQFTASDPLRNSVRGTFAINVSPVNDLPTLLTNTGLSLVSGQTAAVGNSLLRVTDADDSAAQLRLTLIGVPAGGTLELNGAVLNVNDSFTQADIDQELLAYRHNGVSAGLDSFSFTVSDAVGGVIPQTAFDIQLTAPPVLATNNGLDLDEGRAATIGQDRLEVSDPDNADGELTFSLTAAPQHGNLELNHTSLAAGSTWTQADINNNRLSYAHDGSETTSDSFQFAASDPSRNSVPGTFSIAVSLVNDLPTLSTNAGLTLVSGQTSAIDSSRLRVTDADQSAAQLRFTLTGVPANGALELNGTALGVNDVFTQDDVNQGRLAYRHNGGNADPDGFLFTVADGAGGAILQSTFDITVTIEPPTSEPQYAVKQTPRLQLGNAPLAGFPGSNRDQVEVLWQTVPTGTGTADRFVVEYRRVGQSSWTNAGTISTLDTGVEGRIVHSAVIGGLDYNAQYEYQVRHLRSGSTIATYLAQFRTRLSAGDESSFRFAAYGDSAILPNNSGFRSVQSRITQNGTAFSILLGDNAYGAGLHSEFDARFDPTLVPEATAWNASHIDYASTGNHEYNSGGQAYLDSFSMPIPIAGVTAPATPQVVEPAELTYSFDYGSVHFASFDSDKNTSGSRLDQTLDWLVADMQASTAQWKVVFAHHPIAGTPDKNVSPGGEYFQKFVSRLRPVGVDLLVVGHSHTYGWTYPLTGSQNGQAVYVNDQDKVYAKGAGLIQVVSGTGGKEVRSGTYSQFPYFAAGYAGSTNPQGEDGHAQFDVTPSQLIVSYIAADNGAIIDQFTIADFGNRAVFTQGENGNTDTMDTTIRQSSPNANDALTSVESAGLDVSFANDQPVQSLTRFDDLVGNGASQILAGSMIDASYGTDFAVDPQASPGKKMGWADWTDQPLSGDISSASDVLFSDPQELSTLLSAP